MKHTHHHAAEGAQVDVGGRAHKAGGFVREDARLLLTQQRHIALPTEVVPHEWPFVDDVVLDVHRQFAVLHAHLLMHRAQMGEHTL
jgi:hypothetical protein